MNNVENCFWFLRVFQSYGTKFFYQGTKRNTCLSWRICQDAVQLLKLYERILSLQCEHIKHALHKANGDNLIAQCTQQLQKTTARQLSWTLWFLLIKIRWKVTRMQKNVTGIQGWVQIFILKALYLWCIMWFSFILQSTSKLVATSCLRSSIYF